MSIFFLAGCGPSALRLTGVYTDRSRPGDTLTLFPDKTYEYQERLQNNIAGWTYGHWEASKRRVRFTIAPRPLMGFGLKVRKDSSGGRQAFRLLLGNSGKGVPVERVEAFHRNRILEDSACRISGNLVEPLNPEIDSLAVFTHDYQALELGSSYRERLLYNLELYPVERYYLLDQYVFVAKKARLENMVTRDTPPAYMHFEKLRGDPPSR
jgi:hypothetical protein